MTTRRYARLLRVAEADIAFIKDENMNRDYFTRPAQGNARDCEGYGLTELHHEESATWRDVWECVQLILAVSLLVALVVFVVKL